MQINFPLSLVFVEDDEGGMAIRANEPGGACNKGISFLVFEAYCAKHGLPTPTFDDLRRISDEVAGAIYREQFADVISFDELPDGLDYALLNTAVMQGPTGAIRLLQQALLVNDVDGHLGLVTWKAINGQSATEIVPRLLDLQLAVKRADPHWFDHLDPKTGKMQHGFGPGWQSRLKRVANRARTMMQTHG